MLNITGNEVVQEAALSDKPAAAPDLSQTISMQKPEPEPVRLVKEKAYRSVLKSFSWRITATLTTITIAYMITGDVGSALEIGGAEFVIKMVVYFGHERLWSRLKVGQVVEEQPPIDYQI